MSEADFNIPDFMPRLRQGTGATPKDGGCLVQVAGWLNDGHSWTDSTPCVHPVLRSVAIHVNDAVSDAARQELLTLAPRLIGTGLSGDVDVDKMVSVRLAVWSARQVLHLVSAEGRGVCEKAIEAAEAWAADPSPETQGAAWDAASNAASNAARSAAWGAAYSAAWDAAYSAAWDAAYSAAWGAAWSAAWDAASSAASSAAYSAARAARGAAGHAASIAASNAASNAANIGFLVGLIDEYDRIAGRETTGVTIPVEQWVSLADAMA